MKKILSVFVTILLCITMTLAICACGGSTPNGDGNNNSSSGTQTPGEGETTKEKFTDAAMADLTVSYDGQAHALSVTGAPEGTDILYENNDKTDAGTYTVKATLTKEGYESKTLTATLQINKAEFTGITFSDETFINTGAVRSLAVVGTLPEGTQVSYTNNDKKEVGVYTVKATLTNPNYVTKVMEATLTIKGKVETALSIVNSLLDKPDPWSFMPEALTPERMAYNQMPVGGIEGFASFVNVSQIQKKSIGKQFNVLYEGLCDTASLLSKIDTVYAVGNTIADVYQTFINKNPDDFAQFTGEAAGFKVKIILDGQKSVMLAGNSTVSLELEYDKETETRTGRIQLTDGAALKYISTPTALKFAVKMTIAGVGNLKQIEFVRSEGAVAGYLREFTGTETKNLKTTGVIASNAQTTVIMSNKRESDDLKINGYEEAYSSVTGEMIGGEVQETVKLFDYDTLWLHLSDIGGLNSVRILDDANGLNADTIYLNGQSEAIKTKNVSITKPSRRFDIEMKEVWYVVKQVTDDKTEYKLQKTLVPMLFVQKENTDTFAADFKEKNSYVTSPSLPAQNIATVGQYFETLQTLFEAATQQVTYQEIDLFIGDKNSFLTHKSTEKTREAGCLPRFFL